jgi:hypothetical protein
MDDALMKPFCLITKARERPWLGQRIFQPAGGSKPRDVRRLLFRMRAPCATDHAATLISTSNVAAAGFFHRPTAPPSTSRVPPVGPMPLLQHSVRETALVRAVAVAAAPTPTVVVKRVARRWFGWLRRMQWAAAAALARVHPHRSRDLHRSLATRPGRF